MIWYADDDNISEVNHGRDSSRYCLLKLWISSIQKETRVVNVNFYWFPQFVSQRLVDLWITFLFLFSLTPCSSIPSAASSAIKIWKESLSIIGKYPPPSGKPNHWTPYFPSWFQVLIPSVHSTSPSPSLKVDLKFEASIEKKPTWNTHFNQQD